MVRDGSSETLERFIAESNVSNFFQRLDGEQELGKRAVLSDILLVEENRFAYLAARFDQFEFYVRRCDDHIAKCKLLMDGTDHSANRQLLERVLRNMCEIKTTLQSASAVAADGLDRLDRP